ncbi:APC family permease [Tessaracoccus oleiagri]|uniref:Amino acid/polyamine/organocation transporter, APC superfamily (TC 2.A.3) n=1 Tax=Tessaracoccus oleiagri TaxID=686624 RepID=A0A1G9M2F2_9ACTN|nr:APC family permease [Tessaracoccus oleiagri]SDL68141.1 amino acid/polyamine/organocation transporter, APC superfamily (TC 2.A.3) [Tessaracoccus oleiagri]
MTTSTTTTPLRRAVTTPSLFLFILGDVLGAGVYILIGTIAATSGGAVWVPLIVALLMVLLTAGSYAELATKYPRAGGSSHYAKRAFGPFVGFLVGFCMLAAGIVSVGALALGFAGDYLGEFLTAPVRITVAVFLLLLAALNAYGIRESMWVNMVATVIEVGGLLLVIVVGALVIARGDGDPSRLVQLGTATDGPVTAVLAGTVLAYYSYVGFETSVNVAEEANDPSRSYPRALFGALVVAGLVYVGVGVAASAVIPTSELAASSGPLLEVVRAAGGVPPVVFSVIALVAVGNGALLTGIMTSRLTYGMSRDGLLPGFLSRVLPNRRTPWTAILVTTALSLVLALIGSIEVLASTLVLLLLVVFIAVNAVVLVLRRDHVEHVHFRVPRVLPVLGIASCLLLATQIEAETWQFGLPLLAAGALFAAVAHFRLRRGGARQSG